MYQIFIGDVYDSSAEDFENIDDDRKVEILKGQIPVYLKYNEDDGQILYSEKPFPKEEATNGNNIN